MSVKLTVNGEKMELEKVLTVGELLTHLDLSPKGIFVEYNREPLHSDSYGETRIKDNDNIEIVAMMAGG